MPSTKTVSKARVALTWLMMIVAILGITTFFFIRGHGLTAPPADETDSEASSPGPLFHAIFFLFAGTFVLVAGIAGYFIVLFTCALTFSFNRPQWNAVKTKQYFLNIAVTVALGLGLGLIVSAVATPLLQGLGVARAQANLGPVLGMLIIMQFLQLWVLIWSPLERRFIHKRLAAQGITAEQLAGTTLIGLSNPASGLAKRFGAIEEDMGALWITPDRLAFRGDVEQFDLTREQVVEIERRADNRSVTVLAGIAHVVLHVQLPDGNLRQIRLHTEGIWTLGQKGKAMNALAEAIEQWRGQTT